MRLVGTALGLRGRPHDSVELTAAIRALGDYAHVNVRPHRGLSYIYADERDDLDDPADAVARLSRWATARTG